MWKKQTVFIPQPLGYYVIGPNDDLVFFVTFFGLLKCSHISLNIVLSDTPIGSLESHNKLQIDDYLLKRFGLYKLFSQLIM
jgi:hypothetical protein